ncbi:MAG: hypothetical protein AAGA57_07105 [Planctomycetota bacterium]
MSDLDLLRQRADALDQASRSRRKRKPGVRDEFERLRETPAPQGQPPARALEDNAVHQAAELTPTQVRRIADWQRHGIIAIVLQLSVFPIVFGVAIVAVVANVNTDAVLIPVIFVMMLQFVVGWFYGEIASYKLHRALGAGPAMAWSYVLLGLLPVTEWLVLWLMNQKATRILKHHGVLVGFWGAKRKTIPPRPAPLQLHP